MIRGTSFLLTSDDSAVFRGAPGSMVSHLVHGRKENAGGLQKGAWGKPKMRCNLRRSPVFSSSCDSCLARAVRTRTRASLEVSSKGFHDELIFTEKVLKSLHVSPAEVDGELDV